MASRLKGFDRVGNPQPDAPVGCGVADTLGVLRTVDTQPGPAVFSGRMQESQPTPGDVRRAGRVVVPVDHMELSGGCGVTRLADGDRV